MVNHKNKIANSSLFFYDKNSIYYSVVVAI